ncbi:cytochrome-c peroxidase [Spongorhabdus nitratireducens]
MHVSGAISLGLGLCVLSSTAFSTAKEPIEPIEPAKITDAAKVELGKQLYFDPRLSKSGFLSCNSCHNLSMGGTDNLPSSIGHQWTIGPINAPTVLNSSFNLAQFWDGRAKDLQEQAGGPIANPKEMAFSHELAVNVLETIPQYRASFKNVFGDQNITIDQVTDAIASFEETLVTPGSRFDQWLKGDETALTQQEKSGYQLFKDVGCTACHSGPAVGGMSYQKFGLIKPYITDNPATGRAAVTGNEYEKFFFKVPTLRNIELTYPYFHDGSVWDLGEAVDIMAELQLGRTLNKTENTQIVAFLKTLTGDQPDFKLPILPPSQPDTPRPDVK